MALKITRKIRISILFLVILSQFCIKAQRNEIFIDPGIYILGGQLSRFRRNFSQTVQKLDIDQRRTTSSQLDERYEGIDHAGLLDTGHFVFGLQEGRNSAFHGVGFYNPVQRIVTEFMNDPISTAIHSSTVINGTKFILCGTNLRKLAYDQSWCIVVNVKENTKKQAVFNDKKGSGCVLDYGDGVHVLYYGGWTQSVYKMNTDDMRYTKVGSMPNRMYRDSSRTAQACSIYGKYLLMCGGNPRFNHKWKRLRTCFTYSTSDNTFRSFPSLVKARAFFQIAEWKGKLYALGGVDEDWNYLSSIEVYDGKIWSIHPQLKLNQGLKDFGIVVVNEPTHISSKRPKKFYNLECHVPEVDMREAEMEIIDEVAIILCENDALFPDKTNVFETDCIDGKWDPAYDAHKQCVKPL